ncbi:MAG: UDP-2,3-diacylglucosamine diphosphatase [Gemmatimonadota bacterium]|jgi:UDP-2,3-diacylglucosamine hydrolase|nr:UDP-2,3-diacylglucosamine diphosphatase [Gemmatimonadota bacterium]
MSVKPIMVVSDIHLGAVPAETERRFRHFLGFVRGAASGLLINGDLFDFWFEYRTVVPRQHLRVLAALADVVESGLPVWFVGGNHDAWGGSFLQDEIGMKVLQDRCEMTLAGYRALIAHGDGVGTGDLGYKALRRFIRHPWTVRSFRAIHPDLGSRIAARASSTEHKVAVADPGGESRAQHIQRWAVEQMADRPDLDLILAGHAHIPVVLEVEPNRFYVNSGDWLRHFSYVALTPGKAPTLARWEG